MIEIKDKVFWVGVKDWEIKRFHGEEYSTHRGSTYVQGQGGHRGQFYH